MQCRTLFRQFVVTMHSGSKCFTNLNSKVMPVHIGLPQPMLTTLSMLGNLSLSKHGCENPPFVSTSLVQYRGWRQDLPEALPEAPVYWFIVVTDRRIPKTSADREQVLGRCVPDGLLEQLSIWRCQLAAGQLHHSFKPR